MEHFSRWGPLGVVVSALVSPRQFVERWLIATSAVAIFCHVEFLMLVIFHAGTVLSTPAISFSVDAMRFHKVEYRAQWADATPLGA